MLFRFSGSTLATTTTGYTQFNNLTLSSVTHLYVSETDRNGANIDKYLDSVGVGDYIKIFSEQDNTKFHLFQLSSGFTSGAGVDDMPVTYIVGNGTFALNELIGFSTATKGNAGTSGTNGVGISNITFLLAVGTILTTGTNKARVTVPYVGTILKAYASSGTGPQGADDIFDIYRNGVSIWNITQSNRLKILSGQTYGTQSSFDITSIAEGDILSIDVDQVGSTTPGGDISVQLKIQI